MTYFRQCFPNSRCAVSWNSSIALESESSLWQSSYFIYTLSFKRKKGCKDEKYWESVHRLLFKSKKWTDWAKNSKLFLIFFFFYFKFNNFCYNCCMMCLAGSLKGGAASSIEVRVVGDFIAADSREDSTQRNFPLQTCSKSIPGLCSSLHIKLSSSVGGDRVRNEISRTGKLKSTDQWRQ